MKAWYDDIDAATLQRIKAYSAFNDTKSKNLMMQTMYEYREKEIQDFKETNHELAETCIARKKRIAELEKENAELKEKVGKYQIGMFDEIEKRDRRITKAKEIIREFVEWANWQGSNCPSFKSIQNKAEQFLKDLKK